MYQETLLANFISSPSFDIPAPDPQQQAKKAAIVCHMCGEAGHKALHCPRPIQPMAWNLLVQSRQESQVSL